MTKDVAVLAATRTGIGAFQGSLANLPASDLGAALIRSVLEETGIAPEEIDEVILGQVVSAGGGQIRRARPPSRPASPMRCRHSR